MGTLRSASDCTGIVVNGITLGQPTFTDEINEGAEVLFAWDDSLLPSGLINDDGTITVDEMDGE
jgi:hypothetical protein